MSEIAEPPRLSVLLLYGTRPEIVKMAPVVEALRQRPERFRPTLCATGQHREMADQIQSAFGLVPDVDLDLMRPGQELNDLAARGLAAVDRVLAETAPDWVLVQGDTTSATIACLAAFHRRVRVGHVEAGLRTGDLGQPFPEEGNRRVIDVLGDALFAPTPAARDRLLAEGVPPHRVHLTGNTVVDALVRLRRRLAEEGGGGEAVGEAGADRAGDEYRDDDRDGSWDGSARGEVLVTAHRRESFGAPLAEVFAALRELAEAFPAVRWIYPVHPNPQVLEPARRLLSGLPNLELRPPMGYPEMVAQLARCRLVLTDSGGLQEEAPAFGKPVLVLRDKTERAEGVEAGVARLVGTDRRRIVAAVRELLTNRGAYRKMVRSANPYGDGRASERIAAVLAGEPYQPFAPSAAAPTASADTRNPS